MAEAQRLAHIGNWSFDTANGERTWSDELYRIYGYEAGAFEPDLEHFFDRLHPDDADRVRTAVLSNVSRALPSENEFRLVLPGGEVRWLAARTEPVLDDRDGVIGLHGITQDVTERKEVEERLRFQAHLLDAVGEAVIATDLSGTIVYWGPGAEELYGWTAQEALTRMIGEVTPSNATAEAAVEIMGQLAQGERWAGLMEVRRRDDSTFLAEIADTPVLDAAGQLVAIIGISTDVSARERANAELAAAHDAALEASLLKSHFLANMSHEIRTPMNGILGMTELLLDSPLDARQRDFAETVRVSGDALLAIINDILDLSKVEAGVVELESVDFELSSVIRNVTDLLAGSGRGQGARPGGPRRRRRAGAPRRSPAHPPGADQFDRQRGEVHPRGPRRRIGVRGRHRRRPDDGSAPGRRHRHRHRAARDGARLRAFRPGRFVHHPPLRGHRPGPHDHPPAGRPHGRPLRGRQHAGEGEQLLVHTALAQGGWDRHGARTGRWPRAGLAGGARSCRGRSKSGAVLLAEDNLINRKVALAMLVSGGYRVDVALDGSEALSAVRAGHYDVILMDCQMPGMDGYEAAAAIRAEEGPGRRVPIVAMTAGAMPEDRERALAAGMDDYLAKPVRRADMLAAVGRWARTG